MQKDVIHNDPFEGDDENRAVGVSVGVRIPFRAVEVPDED